ncbi:MAG: helix-turn-helix domain-containing protein [Chitinivibrionales bacterium]|nr:helix-turn-helix domain-containing protein [Chitinivibrionales bacterium]
MAPQNNDWLEGLQPRVVERRLSLGHRHGWIRAEIKAHRNESKPVVAGSNSPLAVNVVLRGEGAFTDELNNTRPLSPGACFVPIPGLDGRAVYTSPSTLEFYLAFDRFTSRSLRDLGFVRTVPYARVPADETLRTGIVQIMDWISLDPEDLSDRDLLLRLIDFMDTLQAHGKEMQPSDSLEARIGSACLLLEDPATRGMAMGEIARRVGMSYRAFRTAFAQLKGCTPVAYRIARRMDRACRMLKRKTVKQVAAELGYGDPATFSQQFAKTYGVPPSAYHTR